MHTANVGRAPYILSLDKKFEEFHDPANYTLLSVGRLVEGTGK
jgi:hypothetical protein